MRSTSIKWQYHTPATLNPRSPVFWHYKCELRTSWMTLTCQRTGWAGWLSEGYRVVMSCFLESFWKLKPPQHHFNTAYHLAARAIWYLFNVLSWTVLILTILDIDDTFPMKSSSSCVQKANGEMDGRDFLFPTSIECNTSPNMCFLGMIFHLVTPQVYALWAHFWNAREHACPDSSKTSLSSQVRNNAVPYKHFKKEVAALTAETISSK